MFTLARTRLAGSPATRSTCAHGHDNEWLGGAASGDSQGVEGIARRDVRRRACSRPSSRALPPMTGVLNRPVRRNSACWAVTTRRRALPPVSRSPAKLPGGRRRRLVRRLVGKGRRSGGRQARGAAGLRRGHRPCREVAAGDRFYVRYEQVFTAPGAPVGVARVVWAELVTRARGPLAIHRFRRRVASNASGWPTERPRWRFDAPAPRRRNCLVGLRHARRSVRPAATVQVDRQARAAGRPDPPASVVSAKGSALNASTPLGLALGLAPPRA